jgi:hypothetical protein
MRSNSSNGAFGPIPLTLSLSRKGRGALYYLAMTDVTDRRNQRKRIVVTALILGAVALGFYIFMFVRFS